MFLFVWVRVFKVFFLGGGVIYYNVFVFNKIEFLKGVFWFNDFYFFLNL